MCLVASVLSGCTSIVVSGGAGFDVGTLGVGGIDAGIGAQTEAIGYVDVDGTGVGFGPAVEIAGYNTTPDADPLAFTTIDIRYRRFFRGQPGPYWAAGTGAGLAWSAGLRSAAVPLQIEVGISHRVGRTLLVAGLRNRFLGLLGTGSPPVDAFNSMQVVLGVGFGESYAHAVRTRRGVLPKAFGSRQEGRRLPFEQRRTPEQPASTPGKGRVPPARPPA